MADYIVAKRAILALKDNLKICFRARVTWKKSLDFFFRFKKIIRTLI